MHGISQGLTNKVKLQMRNTCEIGTPGNTPDPLGDWHMISARKD